MKKVIFLIVVLLLGMAASPFLIGNPGYVLVSMGNIAIESSVVAVSIFIILLFIILLLTLKIFRGGWRLGQGTWNKLRFANKRKAQRNFNNGVSAYLIGDHKQAEQLLIKSAEHDEHQLTAYLLAADAAQKENSIANVEYYLKCIKETQVSKNLPLEAALVAIKLQITLKNYQHARELIDQFHQHIGHSSLLLRLEISLSIVEQRFDNAIHYLDKARKDKTIAETQIAQWEASIYHGKFNELFSIKGEKELNEYWQKLSRKLRQHEAILLAYCQVLAQYKLNRQLSAVLAPGFKFSASELFIKSLRQLPISNSEELILLTQKNLQKDNTNTKWLSCLGFLAYCDKQYEMARKAYHSLTHQPEYNLDDEDLLLYAKTLIALNEHTQANEILLKIK